MRHIRPPQCNCVPSPSYNISRPTTIASAAQQEATQFPRRPRGEEHGRPWRRPRVRVRAPHQGDGSRPPRDPDAGWSRGGGAARGGNDGLPRASAVVRMWDGCGGRLRSGWQWKLPSRDTRGGGSG
ncbi:hypothetical protein VPH35_057610 [Triticum aestivum]